MNISLIITDFFRKKFDYNVTKNETCLYEKLEKLIFDGFGWKFDNSQYLFTQNVIIFPYSPKKDRNLFI